jgi:hypothetical protein
LFFILLRERSPRFANAQCLLITVVFRSQQHALFAAEFHAAFLLLAAARRAAFRAAARRAALRAAARAARRAALAAAAAATAAEVLANLAHQLEERLFDVDARLGRRLHERNRERFRQILALARRHLTLVLQIRLVRHQHHRRLVGVLHSQNLLAKRRDFVKRRARRNAVHHQEALTSAHILLIFGDSEVTC